MDSAATLDSEELMHLALYASEHDTPEKAIGHLKRLLNNEPRHGQARYFLGALHAEIGMYDKAVEEMTEAISVDPNLPPTAHFQLGLIHLTSGRIDEAKTVWQDLDKLGENHFLHMFKTGMLHLVDNEFDSCINLLDAGIKQNTVNEDLNNDMRRVIQQAENAGGKPAANDASASTSTLNGQRMLLSAYQRDSEE